MIEPGTTERGFTRWRALPLVRVFAAHARKVRPGALGAPLERVVVHALGRQGVMAVPLHFIAQGADHLRVAVVAALADEDVPARQLERGVGTHPCTVSMVLFR